MTTYIVSPFSKDYTRSIAELVFTHEDSAFEAAASMRPSSVWVCKRDDDYTEAYHVASFPVPPDGAPTRMPIDEEPFGDSPSWRGSRFPGDPFGDDSDDFEPSELDFELDTTL